jgi:hypothetical protein
MTNAYKPKWIYFQNIFYGESHKLRLDHNNIKVTFLNANTKITYYFVDRVNLKTPTEIGSGRGNLAGVEGRDAPGPSYFPRMRLWLCLDFWKG